VLVVDVVRHDVVIVGGGCAGLRAAIAAVEADPTLSVALVSKVYPMRSHTVSAEGGAAAVPPGAQDDSLEKHAYDTVKGSDFLGDQPVIQYFVEEAPKELTLLEHQGCPWSRNADGTVATRPFGGMQTPRTWYATDKVGFHMLHTLFQTSLKYDAIVRYDEHFVTKLLVDGGQCRGVAALDVRTGKLRAVLGRAVILSTGGAGRAWPFTTNGSIKTGDGMALAYREGVPLEDMEFVQYHPTGLPGTGILITEAARGEGGYLLNSEGERFLTTRDYGVGSKAELGPRDMISRAIIQEVEAGRGITLPGKLGQYAHLDLRHLGKEKLETRLPFVLELTRTYTGVDPVTQPIPIRPVLHYMMGGVDVDIDGATAIGGLYAAGEAACVSLNGANRLGSNSLTECLVFGARAGVQATRFAKGASAGNEAALLEQAEAEGARLDGIRGRKRGAETVAGIRQALNAAMEAGTGVYREQASMAKAVSEVAELKRRYEDVSLGDASKVFNTELNAMLELRNLLDVAETVATAAVNRKESRGAHACRDFPKRNDQDYLHHSLVHFSEAGPRFGTKPVTLGVWVPEERKY
jgi:fumarate reductase flavoprotein subunit